MIRLQNDLLDISIKKTGAECSRIHHKQTGLDYLWNGDPEFWSKHAPVLFPIVGSLKQNTYRYGGRSYGLTRHGFARDKEFVLLSHTATAASYELSSDDTTLSDYPFPFLLRIHYTLEDNRLTTAYEVINTGENEMLFSIGAHPAFSLPLSPGTAYEDYYLEFEKKETLQRWPLSDGLLRTHPSPFLQQQNRLQINHKLFEEDAIVLKHPASAHITLKTDSGRHGLRLHFAGFPYLGIWAAPGAPFLCIEPWCGIADSLHHDQDLGTKEGINRLEPGKEWKRSWSIDFW